MTRWEYEEALFDPQAVWKDDLAELGAAGWELVALIEDSDSADGNVRAVFKRPLPASDSDSSEPPWRFLSDPEDVVIDRG